MAGYMFSVEASVKGHHVCKDIWEPTIGEVLHYEREIRNAFDPQAVAVKTSEEIVGHVQYQERFQLFIQVSYIHHGGSITCIINGHRRYSADLEKGGLEVPCVINFASPPDQTVFGE